MIDKPDGLHSIHHGDGAIVDADEIVAIGFFATVCEIRRPREHGGIGAIEIHHHKFVVDDLPRAAIDLSVERRGNIAVKVGKRHQNAFAVGLVDGDPCDLLVGDHRGRVASLAFLGLAAVSRNRLGHAVPEKVWVLCLFFFQPFHHRAAPGEFHNGEKNRAVGSINGVGDLLQRARAAALGLGMG